MGQSGIAGIASWHTKITLEYFRQSLTTTQPPDGLTFALAGLWWDAKGDWTRADESAQQHEGRGFVGVRLPASQGRRSGKRSLLVWSG
jgi:hypothetical protein